MIFLGPVGVGKTYLASALGDVACRVGHEVLFLRADHMLQGLHQARADCTTEQALRRLLAPEVLLLDNLGLRRVDARQSSDFYEVILEPHRRASTIVTSNRARGVDPALRRFRAGPKRSTALRTMPTSSSSRARATGSDGDPKNARNTVVPRSAPQILQSGEGARVVGASAEKRLASSSPGLGLGIGHSFNLRPAYSNGVRYQVATISTAA